MACGPAVWMVAVKVPGPLPRGVAAELVGVLVEGSCAGTVKAEGVAGMIPAGALTARRVAAAALTLVRARPLRAAERVSVARRNCVPAVLKVTGKVPTPLLRVVL